jgi:hypothetical protein
MADLYRVTYISKRGTAAKAVVVSATTEANAVAAAKTADADLSQHVTAAVVQHGIITGS